MWDGDGSRCRKIANLLGDEIRIDRSCYGLLDYSTVPMPDDQDIPWDLMSGSYHISLRHFTRTSVAICLLHKPGPAAGVQECEMTGRTRSGRGPWNTPLYDANKQGLSKQHVRAKATAIAIQ